MPPSRSSWWTGLRGAMWRVAGLARRGARSRELDEEIAFHVDMQTEKNICLGMAPAEARRAALVRFGGRERWSEAARDEYRSRALEDLARDLRYGAASLRRRPGFAATCVLTIALGLAASVTVFAFVEAVFLRPLPVPHGDRLVRVYAAGPDAGEGTLGYPAYRLLRERARAFDVVAAHYSTAPLYVSGDGDPAEVEGAVVSAEYLRMLGLTPHLGRFFTAAEDSVPDRDAVAVIGYGLWQSRFGGRRDVLGRRIAINGRSFEIVGVAPEGFAGVAPDRSVNQLWIPTMMLRVGYRWCDALRNDPPCAITDVLARRASGVTLRRARAEVSALSRQLATLADPADSLRPVVAAPAVGASPAQQRQTEGLARLLTAIAATLLAVACANLAGLLLARGVARQGEMALRVSLGASRGRLVRQLLAEALVPGIIGGALGVVLSLRAAPALMRLFVADAEGYARHFDVSPTGRTLAFAAGVSLLAVALFGLLPAVRAARADPAEWLKSGGTRAGDRGSRTRAALLAAQVALSLVLLVGAGLLTRSFARITSGQRFDPRHVALLRLRPRLIGHGPDQAQAYLRAVVARLGDDPLVESVALARGVGSVWTSTGRLPVSRPEDAPRPSEVRPEVEYHEVSPGFFATLRIPVLAGREFTEHDRAGAPPVAIVTEALARRLWPGASPLDRAVVLGTKEFRVVGVVKDYRLHTATEAAPAMAFVPFWQNAFQPQVDARLAVRVRGDPAAALPALRRAIASVDAAVPVTETLPMAVQVAASYAQVRLGGAVLLGAATLAVVLSGVGLYGVVAFLVARRTREIGIRVALGATNSDVVGLFVRQGLRAAAAGGAAGLVIVLIGARFLAAWLVGVRPLDGVAFGAATAVVAAVALAASWLPARRAARVDPVRALRAE